MLLCIGCGSSGSSSSSATPTPAPTPTPTPTPTPVPTPTPTLLANIGYLVDAPVSGASYSCGALSGITGTDGSFLFPNYDTNCTFSVGQALLGGAKVPTDNYVFVTDLAGVARSATSNPIVLNIAMFLQTMATNSDMNGTYGKIVLPSPSVTAAFFPTSVNIQTQTVSQLTALLKATNPGPGKTIVSSAIAQANVQKNACAIFGICQTPASYPASTIPPPLPASGVVCPAGVIPTNSTPLLATTSTSSISSIANGVAINIALNCASIGYYVIQPPELTPPSAAQIIAGQNAGSLPADVSGNGVYVGSTTAKTTVIVDTPNLKKHSNFIVYFVAVNITDSSMQSGVQTALFSTIGNYKEIPQMQTGQSSYAAWDDGWYAVNKGIGIPRSYSRSSNGIVTDNVTGLMWQDDANATSVLWTAAAATTCLNLSKAALGGYGDWRLPTALELSYIENYGVAGSATAPTVNTAIPPASNGFAFTLSPSVPPSGYWSITPLAGNASNAWSMSFYDASGFSIATTNLNYVRCVRTANY